MRTRRGGTAITLAIILGVLLAFGAIVIDLGYARVVHAQLQAGADASALAGASRLNGTEESMALARNTAVDVAAQNAANGDALILDVNDANAFDGDVVLGTWSEELGFEPSTDAPTVNAVQVRVQDQALIPLFSRLAFSRDELGAAAVSVAVIPTRSGAGRVPYYLPFGIPDCELDSWGSGTVDQTFVLNPAGADNTGWAGVGEQPNASWVRAHLSASQECMWEWYQTGTVDEACATASASEELALSNGLATSALQELTEAVEEGVPWDEENWGALPDQHNKSNVDTALYGNVIIGPVPVFAGGSEYCENGAWNSWEELTGFVWGVIYDVRWKGKAAQQNVWLRIDPDQFIPIGSFPGGDDHGVATLGPPRVVQ